jgi:hypothetical protein
MPGRSSDSPVLFLVGLIVAAIAFAGTTFLGWEFGGPTDPVPVVIGVACAVVGAVVYLRN